MSIALTDESITTIPRALRSRNKPKKLSKPRLSANRRNARKSTGPRTPSGKSTSSKNALKHGLCSQSARLPNECEATYNLHCSEIEEAYNPGPIPQRILCYQLSDTLWKLGRLNDTERQLFALESRGRSDEAPCQTLARAFHKNPTANSFLLLQRYQRNLQNTFLRLHKELRALKKEQNAPAPRHSEPAWSPAKAQAQLERHRAKAAESGGSEVLGSDWYREMQERWRQRDLDNRRDLQRQQDEAEDRASSLDVERSTLEVERSNHQSAPTPEPSPPPPHRPPTPRHYKPQTTNHRHPLTKRTQSQIKNRKSQIPSSFSSSPSSVFSAAEQNLHIPISSLLARSVAPLPPSPYTFPLVSGRMSTRKFKIVQARPASG